MYSLQAPLFDFETFTQLDATNRPRSPRGMVASPRGVEAATRIVFAPSETAYAAQAAQQDSLATSRPNACAASFRPSLMVK